MLALAIVTAVLLIAGVVLPALAALVVRRAVAGAADAAALAAADTAVGLHPGFPCEVAVRVASANGAALDSCELDGLVVTVQASTSVAGIPVVARATAGPPPDGEP